MIRANTYGRTDGATLIIEKTLILKKIRQIKFKNLPNKFDKL